MYKKRTEQTRTVLLCFVKERIISSDICLHGKVNVDIFELFNRMSFKSHRIQVTLQL